MYSKQQQNMKIQYSRPTIVENRTIAKKKLRHWLLASLVTEASPLAPDNITINIDITITINFNNIKSSQRDFTLTLEGTVTVELYMLVLIQY